MESHTELRPDELRERAWVEVNRSALVRNHRTVQAAVGSRVKLIPMVKADGYGLGVSEVVRTLEPEGVFAFGVATAEEGRELRRLGVTRPVMIHSPVLPESLEGVVAEGLNVTLSDLGGLQALVGVAGRGAGPVQFQIEVDTGMGRSGFPAEEVGTWWPEVQASMASLALSGIWTHLHSADTDDLESARRQVDRFEGVLQSMGGLPEGCLVHYANSAACLRLPSTFADAARPGIFLYGGSVGHGAPTPESVVRVVGRVNLVREVPAGATQGYGATHVAETPARWATVGLGYGDGLPRALGNRGHALVRGTKVPLIGRISMDVSVVDITGVGEAGVGDPVTFVGSDGGANLALDEVAGLVDTIGYEVLTGLSPRLPRVWAEQP